MFNGGKHQALEMFNVSTQTIQFTTPFCLTDLLFIHYRKKTSDLRQKVLLNKKISRQYNNDHLCKNLNT